MLERIRELFLEMINFLTVKLKVPLMAALMASHRPASRGALDDAIACHFAVNNSLPMNHYSDHHHIFLPQEKSIFFLKSSCSLSPGSFSLNAHQACAVESAARQNPSYKVHVLLVGPGSLAQDKLHYMLQHTLKVEFHRINLLKFVNNTPINDLVMKKLPLSQYPLVHLNEILRLLILWKFGGVYIDLDVLLLEPLDQLPPCFVGVASTKEIGRGVLALDKSATGKMFIRRMIQELLQSFDGCSLDHNGAGLVRRVIEKICPTRHLWFPTYCRGLHLVEHCYLKSLQWNHWRWYAWQHPARTTEAVNHVSSGKNLSHAKPLYNTLANVHCPKVHSIKTKEF